MRSYAQYCPIAKASEILGDRWTLLIVREMLGAPRASTSYSAAYQGSRGRSSLTAYARWKGPRSLRGEPAPRAGRSRTS